MACVRAAARVAVQGGAAEAENRDALLKRQERLCSALLGCMLGAGALRDRCGQQLPPLSPNPVHGAASHGLVG